MLELLSVIEKKGRHVNRGKIEVALNNSKLYRETIHDIVKPHKHVQDAGAKVAQMKNC